MDVNDEEKRTNYLFGRGLLKLAEELRMQSSGSADPWGDIEVREVGTYLHHRLDVWSPSTPGRELYDNAVRLLVSAALAEVDCHGLEARVKALEAENESLRTQIRCGF